jgi:endonuclease/exonuclease/phosphatase family metal-dependent hydrolase
MWGNGPIFNKALNFLVIKRPDIACLQEVFDGHNLKINPSYRALDLLRKKLGLKYFYFSPAADLVVPDGKFLHGNVIFSRWPIVRAETTFYDKLFDANFLSAKGKFDFYPRNLQRAVIYINKKKELNIFNTHGIYGLHGQDHARRLHLSQVINEQVKGKKKVILSGDFNVNEGTKSIANLEKHLINVFKDERKSSFNMRRKPVVSGYATAVVDFVFATPDVKVIKHSMPDVDVSDHYPLVCTFEV